MAKERGTRRIVEETTIPTPRHAGHLQGHDHLFDCLTHFAISRKERPEPLRRLSRCGTYSAPNR